jgi:D-sedoheptulose 7-phosphate isomerase
VNRAVFLDRDGVINDVVFRDGAPASPRTLNEFALCEGVAEPLQLLADAGFLLFGVSNQPDVARGLLDSELVTRMGDLIRAKLPIEAVHACTHDDADLCDCRKPRPGLIRSIAEQNGIALSESYVIGDSWKDVEAGRRAGCQTILLRRPYNEGIDADHVAGDLAEAADLVLAGSVSRRDDDHTGEYLSEVQAIAAALDTDAIKRLVEALVALRARGGRLFLMGVGGSAANASHAANDFRKIVDLESYCLTDNVAELTARVNDDGWDSAYAAWLQGSRVCGRDAVLVMSVGGGSPEQGISTALIHAIDTARRAGATILGIVGRDGGYTARVADVCVVVPVVNPSRVTPHTEAFQAVVWHLVVSHPALCAHGMTWETIQREDEAVE